MKGRRGLVIAARFEITHASISRLPLPYLSEEGLAEWERPVVGDPAKQPTSAAGAELNFVRGKHE
jgi:hypothetical protein